jgi:acetyl-CoA carboxylase biotin carboxylase subunit
MPPRAQQRRVQARAETRLRKVLIANRGEIAVRIARTCRTMGLGTVAVYSEVDRGALHVRVADEAVCIGPAAVERSYLHAESIIRAARTTGADAIHPGYGFLSENAAFADAVREAGLVFVGPPAEAIAALGDKLVSRSHAVAAGVPVVPGTELAVSESDAGLVEIARHASGLGYPVLVKAAAGGGGRGMRVVRDASELREAIAAAGREAGAAFGDPRVYLEKYLERPRHIEVQILADGHGDIVHLGERECSIQRRHQKIIEETPAPRLETRLRAEIVEAAIAVARRVGYVNAGTVEFLLGGDGRFYFLEMNTRLQVEHPVTEWVTGLDLVREQLRVAAGARLGFRQEDVQGRGAALECRIYAEDPANAFLPSAGPVLAVREPAGPGVRVDSSLCAGSIVPVEYDPLLAKISTWGPTRERALDVMRHALGETSVVGPATNVEFLAAIVADPVFHEGALHTDFVPERFGEWQPDGRNRDLAALVAALVLSGSVDPSDEHPGGGFRRPAAGHDTGDDSPWIRLGPWRVGG